MKGRLGASLLIKAVEQWETILRSFDTDIQISVVRMAEDAAGAQGLLAAVWSGWRDETMLDK